MSTDRLPGTSTPPAAAIASETVAAWAERAQGGDADAFASLYHARARSVTRYVAALVRDPDRVDDLVAQTFLLAWKDLPRLRDCARFDAWLFRIAHNQVFSELRRRRYTADLDAARDVAETNLETLPEARLDWQLSVEELRRSIDTLPEDQRTVVTLRFFAELPHRDIAQQLGKTDEAVRALQHRALARLRKALRGS